MRFSHFNVSAKRERKHEVRFLSEVQGTHTHSLTLVRTFIRLVTLTILRTSKSPCDFLSDSRSCDTSGRV